jgi:FlaA1/EpsC-like NDP-sugar epimerase
MQLTYRSSTTIVLQGVLVVCSWTLAWLLRFDFSLPNASVVFSAVPLLLVFRLASLACFNLLDGYWRYTGMNDVEDIIKAILLGSAGLLISSRYVFGFTAAPLSIYVLEMVLTIIFLIGIRFVCRRHLNRTAKRRKSDLGKRVLVVGAGDAAESLIRQLARGGYAPVGCVDDNPVKASYAVHGVSVLGTTAQIPELAIKHWIDEILIAVPSATGSQMRDIVASCQRSKRDYRTIPGVFELVAGEMMLQQLREVKLEDLLGRDPVQMNLDTVRQQIENKVVMVTGAAGSIGSELCRQILGYGPTKLICLDQAETPLFYLQQGLVNHPLTSRAVYSLADIGDSAHLRNVLTDHGVQIIFHAAAYKHVPMVEENLPEALKNNVFALLRLLDVASEAGCEQFLLISSDKAVQPTSFMGCTKRLGELIISARPPSGMRCSCVRFGNVLGSQGSVVPILQEQIRTTQTVTITHPDITRYFMTIPEAVSLVLQASTLGAHASVLVLDMGEPMRIVDLAKTLIRLSGKSESQVEVVFTGLRPGEKLYEELFYEDEDQVPTLQKKVFCTRASAVNWANLSQQLSELRQLAAEGMEVAIRAKVKEIVPQYNHISPTAAPHTIHTAESNILGDSIATVSAECLPAA